MQFCLIRVFADLTDIILVLDARLVCGTRRQLSIKHTYCMTSVIESTASVTWSPQCDSYSTRARGQVGFKKVTWKNARTDHSEGLCILRIGHTDAVFRHTRIEILRWPPKHRFPQRPLTRDTHNSVCQHQHSVSELQITETR